MTILGFALGLIELIFITVFSLAMVVSTSFDRRGFEGVKWLVLFVGIVLAAIFYWSEWSFAGLGKMLLESAFWIPVGIYFGIGIIYSVIEFMIEVRRSAKFFKEEWDSVVKTANEGETPSARNFCNRYKFNQKIVQLEYDSEIKKPVPKINKSNLANYYSAWTFFWPFYLLSLVFDDFLHKAFRVLSELLTIISNRFVKTVFNDVFK